MNNFDRFWCVLVIIKKLSSVFDASCNKSYYLFFINMAIAVAMVSNKLDND